MHAELLVKLLVQTLLKVEIFPILILFFSGKKEETMTATEASCYEVEKSITAGNCISANKQFSSILEDPLKQVVCSSSSSDSSDESSSDEFDSRLVV